ncbi:dnaJ homolog subfamily C member 22 [Schistocerca americana]|uniref:dnaJ homolog subfamily C member 22 n=1 Tax=Schistocerca americana TaxID=7009 RepID=UPI001F4FC3DF|nr:dnaJ homolog subfamily C member 22 [Schistocerca americana]
MAKKSVFLTYLLWLVGGVFGLHHLYLGRDLQAFLWCCTLGGYVGCGWLRDIVFIPEYVADANEDEKFMEKYVEKIRKHNTPPFSLTRYTGMIIVAYVFTSVLMLAIPEEEVGGIDWNWLVVFVPLACALGVWAVGNIGRQKGTIWWALAAAFAVYPFRTYFSDDSTWLTTMTFLSASAFDNKSKQWRRTHKRRSLCRRLTVFTLCLSLYMSLWCSYIYFNAKLTDSNGEEVRVHEALHHLFTSPLWTDLKQSLKDTYNFAQHHGWYETWKLVVDLSDPHGEQNAYKVLEVSSSATQAEITSSWRALSRKYHPDKVKDPDKRREAQEKFMEIQQAYEIVSSIRAKRSSRNKRYNP